MQIGDTLSLVVGPKEGNHACDTTIVQFEIAEIGGNGRVWNLTGDVVDNVYAGNPHPDRFGNAGVWHFHAFTAPSEPPVRLESNAKTAKEYLTELAAKNLETTRQRVRKHPEQTWDGAVGAMFPNKTLPALPKPGFENPMKVEVPCASPLRHRHPGAERAHPRPAARRVRRPHRHQPAARGARHP